MNHKCCKILVRSLLREAIKEDTHSKTEEQFSIVPIAKFGDGRNDSLRGDSNTLSGNWVCAVLEEDEMCEEWQGTNQNQIVVDWGQSGSWGDFSRFSTIPKPRKDIDKGTDGIIQECRILRRC